MSTLEVNSIDKESGSTLTLGGSGTQVTVHASATTSGFPEAGLASVQTFTSSGTWTRPTGITKVIMEVQGAGGGGSGNDGTGYKCTGGGGGGYARKFLDVSSISTSTITVGSGGSGGSGASNGGAGGASSWADGTNTITGNGGNGGVATPSDNHGEAGGSATGGDINIDGGYSMSVYSTAPWSYQAGNSFLGIAGNGRNNSSESGRGYGAGGGAPNGGSGSGSVGATGIVIVWEYK